MSGERIVPGTERWDRGYPDHIQRYEFAARFLADGMNVLDAGCGCGYGAAFLADHGAATVVAADISAEAIETGRQHFDRDNIEWTCDDCETLEESSKYGPFDLIVNFENIEHLTTPARFVARASTLLNPGGTLISSTPNRIWINTKRGRPVDAPPTNPFHVREFSEREFRDLLSAGFSDVAFWYQCDSGELGDLPQTRDILRVLWTNPAVRAGRLIQRYVFRRSVPSLSYNGSSDGQAQWCILANHPGEDRVAMLIAVCKTTVNSESTVPTD